MDTDRDSTNHWLIGGALCLDFVNTLYGHPDGPIGEPRHEYLRDYRDLVLWSWHARVLTEQEATALLESAKEHPREASHAFHRAIDLRETLYRIFMALMNGGTPSGEDLDELNRVRNHLLAISRLILKPGRLTVEWPHDSGALDYMLSPVILSAIELLTSDLHWLKKCGTCDWLFIDASRNHMRRWCSMEHCGNRSKSRRQYERRKAAQGKAP